MVKLATQQTGKCGELLVQYILLKHGIESALLTTDTGIDLIAYVGQKPVTIQVKTSTHRGPDNDKWLLWEIPENSPANYIAAVDLERNKFWLFRTDEFKQQAKHAAAGRLRLWWSLPGYESERSVRKEEQFKDYEMESGIKKALSDINPSP